MRGYALVAMLDDELSNEALEDLPGVNVATNGVYAAELLLDLIDGAAAPTAPTSVPTALIARRSCGCDTALATFLTSSNEASTGEWRHDLAYSMVTLLQYPLQPNLSLEPRRVWPAAPLDP